MVRKKAAGYLVIPVAALTLAACGSGGGTAGGGSSGGSSGGGGGEAIGMTLSTLNNPFFVEVRDGAQTEASKLNVKLTVQDSQNDASQQANHIQNFITQQDKAILVNPVDSDAIVPSVKAANNANIPVIAVDRGANGGNVVTTVASDNVQGGRDAADQIAALVGSGPIVVLQGIPGTSAERDRSSGFKEQIAKHPSIQVVATQPADFDRTKGLDVMQNLLQAHPDLKGVFAENDEMALGAIKALGSKAGTSVKVVGFDGTPDGLKAVEAGQINSDIAQQPSLLGQLAVENAVNELTGKQVQNPLKVPVKVVNKDNVAEFMATKPSATP